MTGTRALPPEVMLSVLEPQLELAMQTNRELLDLTRQSHAVAEKYKAQLARSQDMVLRLLMVLEPLVEHMDRVVFGRDPEGRLEWLELWQRARTNLEEIASWRGTVP